jgi:hypothetical protein
MATIGGPLQGEKKEAPVSEPTGMHAAMQNTNIYMDDARDALLGIPSELMRGNESVYNVIVKKNRLRGLGVLLVIIALIAGVLGLVRW